MLVYLNDVPYETDFPISVSSFFSQFPSIQTQSVALAVNHCIVPQLKWDEHLLQAGDNLLLIKATKGG
jgi:sulfur carrier protein